MVFVLGSEEEVPTVKVPPKGKAVPAKPAAKIPTKSQGSSEEESSSDEDDTPRKYNSLQLSL
jgi:hypothetical protein